MYYLSHFRLVYQLNNKLTLCTWTLKAFCCCSPVLLLLCNHVSDVNWRLYFFFNQVDVYSFGLLLCEMCVRELPVPQEVHCQISQVTNSALRGLIERCVKRDPEERPTMSDIICELEQLAEAVSIWSLGRTCGTRTKSRKKRSKIFRSKPTVQSCFYLIGILIRGNIQKQGTLIIYSDLVETRTEIRKEALKPSCKHKDRTFYELCATEETYITLISTKNRLRSPVESL